MSWTILNFGKYKGKTLPQVLFSDPDWFFWAIEDGILKDRGPVLHEEAIDLNYKARNIKIGSGLKAEYSKYRPTMKFAGLELVPQGSPLHQGSTPTSRKDVIDLSVPRKMARGRDVFGNRLMLASVKYCLFGSKSVRMTKKCCEDFFDNPDNFLTQEKK
jgi:hypothetical protein